MSEKLPFTEGGIVFRSLCDIIDSPFARHVKSLYDSGLHKPLSEVRLDPANYTDVDAFRNDYLLSSFLSKWKGLRTGVDTKGVAIRGWLSAEIMCKETNRRLRSALAPGGLNDRPDVVRVITRAQRKIESVLGVRPPPSIFDQCRWSGGATFNYRRGTSVDQKATGLIDVTIHARKHLKGVIERDPHWFASIAGDFPVGAYSVLPSVFEVVPGNRLVVVDKNAKTGRTIACEPTGNSFLQQGAGRYIRHRLKRFGVDLDDQSKNQKLASLGFALDYATLDLKAASDSITTTLVWLLLPLDWANFLDDLRSPYTRHEGDWVKLEKFSSMGNAFTFELESLIFWAVSSAVTELASQRSPDGTVAVFGDDIIVPADAAELLVSVLSFFGFETNSEKSYISGPFRESCGRHYFHGVDVTPCYQKECWSRSDWFEEIRLHNRLYRWVQRSVEPDERIYALLKRKFAHIPLIQPDWLESDGARLCKVDDLDLPFVLDRGFRVRVLGERSNHRRADNPRYLLAYKLRRPEYSNPDPHGRCSVPVLRSSRRIYTRYVTRWST